MRHTLLMRQLSAEKYKELEESLETAIITFPRLQKSFVNGTGEPIPYIPYQKPPIGTKFDPKALPLRIREKIHLDPDTDCWLWLGCLSKKGYGDLKYLGKTKRTHRVSWELLVGPIPPGLEIDHLCRTPRCCNPRHLEPVPKRVNYLRGNGNRNKHATHCKHGHPFDAENTGFRKNGERYCRECKRQIRRSTKVRDPEGYRARVRAKHARYRARKRALASISGSSS